jgi:glycerophosphoryl diester phosphodiesterase
VILKIAHRGASGYVLENTLSSFKKALKLKVDMIELDVHLSKDNHLIVMHDPTLDRTTFGKGRIKDMTLAELKKIKCKNKESILTLEEVIRLINGNCSLLIELKGKGTGIAVANIIKKIKNQKNIIVCSFSKKELSEFHKISPKIQISVLKRLPINYLNFAKKIDAYSINLHHAFVSKGIVDSMHTNGFKVFVWTVNNKSAIERMKKLGVDGIISNYPDRI